MVAVRSGSTTVNNSGASTFVLNKPAGTSLNDLLLAVCWMDSRAASSLASLTPPAGWSQAGSNISATASASVGKQTTGSQSSASSTNKTAVSSSSPSSSGTLFAGHTRMWIDSGSTTVSMVVYADSGGSPGSLLASSDSQSLTNTTLAQIDFTFSGANQITLVSGTTYWIGVSWQDPGTPSVNVNRDATAGGRLETASYLPNPFGTTSSLSGPIDSWVDYQTSPCGKVFYKIASGSEGASYTFNAPSTASLAASMSAVTGVDTSTPIGVNPTLGTGAAGTSQVAPSIAGVAGDLLICSFAGQKTAASSYTAPSGMTEEADVSSALVAMCVDSLVLVSTAATGTKTAVMNGTPDTAYRTFSLMINSGDATVPLTDTGAGTELADILRIGTLSDSGTGADTPAVQILTSVTQTDTGTGVDTPTVAKFTVVALTETGTGVDTPTVVKTDFLSLTDTGTGVESPAILQVSSLSDTGTGTQALAIDVPVGPTDSGIGVDLIDVVVIPFTQILPASKPGVVYDLVAVARIPQNSGPPSFVQVDPIEWSALSYTDTLNDVQEMSISCLWASLTDSIVTRLRDLAHQPTELWLYRNGRLVFCGPIQTGNVSGQSLNIEARGLLTYLKHMFVENDTTFAATDQFTIVKTLIDNWQNTSYGDFGIDTSKIGASGINRDVTYLKKELHNVASRVDDLAKNVNGFNYEVDPISRQMLCYYPLKGVNRSAGEDSVVFDSRNIASSNISFSVTPSDVASDGFGTATDPTGDGNLFSTYANLELRAQYGRTGVAGNFDQVKEQNVLDDAVSDLVIARAEALVVPGPEARDTPDADLLSYAVGDTILYQPNEILTVSKPYRVRKRTVKVSSNGQETVTLEFV